LSPRGPVPGRSSASSKSARTPNSQGGVLLYPKPDPSLLLSAGRGPFLSLSAHDSPSRNPIQIAQLIVKDPRIPCPPSTGDGFGVYFPVLFLFPHSSAPLVPVAYLLAPILSTFRCPLKLSLSTAPPPPLIRDNLLPEKESLFKFQRSSFLWDIFSRAVGS